MVRAAGVAGTGRGGGVRRWRASFDDGDGCGIQKGDEDSLQFLCVFLPFGVLPLVSLFEDAGFVGIKPFFGGNCID